MKPWVFQPADSSEPKPTTFLVLDEDKRVIAECQTREYAWKIVENRNAAIAGAAWIFGGWLYGIHNPRLNQVQPVIESALGPMKPKP